ncbi:MAG: polyphosphate polymerase domain-containing protein [Oscillospiraceae bacterium]|nr:polyphosphate polymerase domain-containing protein [Oscillospiraceae bacterium]
MENTVFSFRRVEKKYLITAEQQAALLSCIGNRLIPDSHGKSTVCSLYLDTPSWRLIRGSIDAGAYKEKLRLRSYGTPTAETPVFLEIKKKYKGVVSKRRVQLPLQVVMAYLSGGEKPCTGQIMEELDYAMRFYGHPQPAMFIACEREAYFGVEDLGLRITFDTNIRGRYTGLFLEQGSEGTSLLPGDKVLMEIKTAGAMPLWLADALDALCLFPGRFSKYGTAYQKMIHFEGVYHNA